MANAVLTREGPLARVWLAAHWERKLSKTQCLQTNIETSVGAIMQDSIALRVSGQLLLGVCKIFSKKARYLLEDCNDALIKIKMAFRPGMVDLPEGHATASLAAITLPDSALSLNVALPEAAFNMASYLATPDAASTAAVNLPADTPQRPKKPALAAGARLADALMYDMAADGLASDPLTQAVDAGDASMALALDEAATAAAGAEWALDLQLPDDADAAPAAARSSAMESLEIEVGRDAAPDASVFERADRFGAQDDSTAQDDRSFVLRAAPEAMSVADASLAESLPMPDGPDAWRPAADGLDMPSLPFSDVGLETPRGVGSDRNSRAGSITPAAARPLAFPMPSLPPTGASSRPAGSRKRKSAHPVDRPTALDAAVVKAQVADTRSLCLSNRRALRRGEPHAGGLSARFGSLLPLSLASGFIVDAAVLSFGGSLGSLLATSRSLDLPAEMPQASTVDDVDARLAPGSPSGYLADNSVVPENAPEWREFDDALGGMTGDAPWVPASESNETFDEARQALHVLRSRLEPSQPAELQALLPPRATRRAAVALFYQALCLATKKELAVQQTVPFGPIQLTVLTHD